ncbi:MAG: AmmeMemoRadiSam system protein B [Candidatus Xenobiia bacterium LiM19]
MTKRVVTVLLIITTLLIFISLGCTSRERQTPQPAVTEKSREKGPVKAPEYAGQFYPSEPSELSALISGFLEKAAPRKEKGTIAALICPHAGYVYSGQIAAYGYKLIEGKPYSTVVVIAPTHHCDFKGFAIYGKGSFQTPLGSIAINEKMAGKLKESCRCVTFDETPFNQEHSLEVQLPFLQTVLKRFTIVPVIAGDAGPDDCRSFAEALKKYSIVGKTLVIASSDMSHYYPYRTAVTMDKKALARVEKMEAEGLLKDTQSGICEYCGIRPVLTAMAYAKEMKAHPVVLSYANSGDTAGDKSRVVGYSSVAFYTEETKTDVTKEAESVHSEHVKTEEFITPEDRKMLLAMARETLEEYLRNGKPPTFFKDSPIPENLKKEAGMFVTLHSKGQLRGCIGYVVGREALHKAVVSLAISSATQDPRFYPVKFEELKDIDIEISVMSPLVKVAGADDIVMGTHGVYIKKGFHSGLFLPQVATETGWDKTTFLRQLCSGKAGLPADAWKDRDTEIYVFTADIFGEKE